MSTFAEIITIGDEILYGQTLDTNSHWMSSELDSYGINVTRKTTIGDKREEILEAIRKAEARADVILITGGLGPTNDDLTKPCLVEYFDTKLVRNQEVLDHIESLFTKAGRVMTELNEKQADLPENCTPIPNVVGTAPGMWFEKDGKVFVSMPGVPFEMRRMMSDQILPKLKEKFVKEVIFHKMIRTIGIPESQLAELVSDWESKLPSHIKLAYLPTMSMVKLRLTARGSDFELLQSDTQALVDEILPTIKKYVYGFDSDEIEEVIGKMLTSRGMQLAIAESCTGGFLSHKITSVPGSSGWYAGSIVPYTNELKTKLLQVDKEIIKEHGAVSEQVVLALAKNVRKNLDADVAVSISGVAGPGGGTEEKPVGTVWIGYADSTKEVARKFQFTKDRVLNINYTAVAALNMIRIYLDKD